MINSFLTFVTLAITGLEVCVNPLNLLLYFKSFKTTNRKVKLLLFFTTIRSFFLTPFLLWERHIRFIFDYGKVIVDYEKVIFSMFYELIIVHYENVLLDLILG
jgi:hypothetical protein